VPEQSWTCQECRVNVRYADGAKAPRRPDGWAKSAGKWLCLRCRRERVMDAAGTGVEGYSERRKALIEFELLRNREATEMDIAKVASCSTAVVRKVRHSLREAGKLPQAA
jgi:hypothetical protein